MKFSFINGIRYDLDFDESLYQEGLKQYLQHLSLINFDKNKNLLQYFGISFFHDSIVNSMQLLPQQKIFNLKLISLNVLEDINTYRKKIGLDIVTEKSFYKKPIIYNCDFSGVNLIKCSVNFDLYETIMDTEISSFDAEKKLYHITISFWDNQELEILCKKVKVMIDKELVHYYTDNRLSKIPYCDLCKSKLLSQKQLNQLLDSGTFR